MTEARTLLVLVVDDNQTNRLVLGKTLEMLGAQVRFAENGAEALDSSASADFDLVLMDLAMPVMDGIEATARLRGRGVVTPIIAVTAQLVQLSDLLDKGFDDYIAKPISIPLIAEALAYAREFCAA
jgi:CheY-like chemotaxis protein